jgi:hypothetical protein
MTTKQETLRKIAAEARICWTCGGEPNPANFGGLCDPCTVEKEQRLSNASRILREHGQSDTELGRALNHLGY